MATRVHRTASWEQGKKDKLTEKKGTGRDRDRSGHSMSPVVVGKFNKDWFACPWTNQDRMR